MDKSFSLSMSWESSYGSPAVFAVFCIRPVTLRLRLSTNLPFRFGTPLGIFYQVYDSIF